MIFRNLSVVECAWKLQVQGKEVDQIPSLELPKPLFTIFVEAVAKVIFLSAKNWFGAKNLRPESGM